MRIFSFRKIRRLFSFASMGITRRGGRGVRRRHNAFQQRRDAFSSWRLNSEQLEPKKLLSATSLTLPPDSTYTEGDVLTFRVDFDEPVDVSDGDPLTAPSVELVIGGVGRSAAYAAGTGTDSLFFNYSVQADEEDVDGIEVLNPILLNGETISNSSGALDPALGELNISFFAPDISGPIAGIKVDSAAPTVSGLVTVPGSGTYITGDVLTFTVTFDEVVNSTNATLPLTIGSNARSAVLATPTSGSGTTTLTFEYTIAADDRDSDGIDVAPTAIVGSVTDGAGNQADFSTATSQSTNDVLVNTAAVTVVTLTPSADGTYKTGDVLTLSVAFNEAVTVGGVGTPQIELLIGGEIKNAAYTNGSGSSTLIFTYAIEADLEDTDGIDITGVIDRNSGTIQDADGIDADLTFTPPATGNINVDSVAPTVSGAVTAPGIGTYITGDVLTFTVTFDEVVNSTNATLPLTIGSNARSAVLATPTSGSGTTTLTFEYTIAADDRDSGGIDVDPTAIVGSVTDDAGNQADFSGATPPTTTGVLVNTAAVTGVTPSADGTYKTGDVLTLSVAFNEAVTVGGVGTPQIELLIGGETKNAAYTTGTGSSTLIFTYAIEADLEDTDGIDVTGAIDRNSGTIQDADSADADLTFTPPATGNINVDSVAPTVSGAVTAPGIGTYITGDVLTFTVTFDEVVNSTNATLPLTIGSNARSAVLATPTSGSGTTTLTFEYTIAADDRDSGGIDVDPTAIVGSVTDDAGNQADFSGATPPTTTGVLVNTAAATVVTPSADGTYKTGDVLTLSVAFSEAVTVDDSVGTPQIELLIGGETKNAAYTSGTGSSTLIFTYAIEADLEDTDGIDVTGVIDLNSGTIQDADGINAELTFTPPPNNINVDSVAPTVSGAVAVPGSGTYNTGDVLTFTVTFDEVVNSTNATLPLTIGSNARSAVLATPSGTGTTTLLFEYTIAADDRDSDGIAVDPTAIVGSVTDDAGNQADFSTATPQSTAGVLVNAAVITSVTLNNSNGTYKTGDILTLNVAFSEEVTVGGVGTPRIGLTIGSNIRFADYDTGSGTTALVFNYTVQTGDLDADGIAVVSPISLNGGTILDANTNDAILTFTPPTTTGVLVDAVAPVADAVTPPPAGSYATGQTLSFDVVFDGNVDVIGTPSLPLDIGGTPRAAAYVSGTGTDTLTFEYTILSTDQDVDGITVDPSSITAGVFDAAGNPATYAAVPVPSTAGVFVNEAVINSVTASANGDYEVGDTITLTATFSQPVDVDTTGGTTIPTIGLAIGSNPRQAALVSGEGTSILVFEYEVKVGDLDADGIEVASPVNLNGGTIQDLDTNDAALAFTPPTTTGILVKTAELQSVTVSDGTYAKDDVISLTATFDSVVTVTGAPRIALTIGTASVFADYDTVSGGSGTTALVFNYTVQTDDLDADGINVNAPILLNGGTIEDAGDNDAILTFTPPTTTGVLVDAVAPVALAVTPHPAGSYVTGQTLSFAVVFDGNVDVIGTPSLPLDIGGTPRAAAYVSGTGTDTLTFEYTILSTDQDGNGITVDPSNITAGVVDAAGNAATYAAVPVPSTAGVFVNAAVINSVTASANGDYEVGDTITLTATFSQPVNVTMPDPVNNIPTIGLAIGSNPRQAAYVSGGGTSILVFEYEVQVGDLDADGIEVASPVNLNGGTIQDLDGHDAVLAFTPPTTTGILVKTAELQSVTVSDGTYATGDVISLTATFDSVVTVGGAGTPRIALTIGSASVFANYDTGSGTTALVFNYTVQTNDLDADGINVNAPILLNGGTIEDAGDNDAILTFTPPTTTGVLVDAVAPVALAVTPHPAGSYVTGQTLSFAVVFDGNVDVIGTPSLPLDIGGTPRAAAYVSGTGTNTLTFEYTILSTDQDGNGITVDPSNITAGVVDAAGNAATYAAVPVPSTAGVFVNAAVINSVTASANGDYEVGDTITLTATFSQPVNVAMPDPLIRFRLLTWLLARTLGLLHM